MKTYLRKIGKNGNKRAEKFRKDLTSPKSIQALQKGIEAIHKLASHPEQLQILLQKIQGTKNIIYYE